MLLISKNGASKRKRRKPLVFWSMTIFISSSFFIYLISPKFMLISPKFMQWIVRESDIHHMCPSNKLFPKSVKFLLYAPHSGFSNQLSEFKNAIILAAILNRTLIIPPILDHHAVVLGSCPKFRVSSPSELRMAVWDHIIHLVSSRRYVSMADIIDLSSLISSSMVTAIDFRVFVAFWCDLNIKFACCGDQCNAISRGSRTFAEHARACGSLLAGMSGNVGQCVYAVEEDCRTVVWTYKQNDDGALDSFQPDEQLKTKKNISYLRRRRDVYKAFGPGSVAENATVLSFGSLFSAPYRGSELYIDIHETPRDTRKQSLRQKVEFLPFSSEIMQAGYDFVKSKIKGPFLCVQLRLLDGQFKNHRGSTFLALKRKLEDLKRIKTNNPINVFVMTDLPKSNWSETYLDALLKSDSHMVYFLQEDDDAVLQTARKLMLAAHALKTSFLSEVHSERYARKDFSVTRLPDIVLYIEEVICSCASLGFVGTSGSTIAENVVAMRKGGICSNSNHS